MLFRSRFASFLPVWHCARLLLLVCLLALRVAAPAGAQNASDAGQTDISISDQTNGPARIVGVYGGVPAAVQAKFNPVSARLTSSSPLSITITLPLNGAKNYVFYYATTGTPGVERFLPAGNYRVDYISASGTSQFAGSVTYAPGSGFLNGVQVPNNPPNSALVFGALGIQGTVSERIGIIQPEIILPPRSIPLQGVTVELVSSATGKTILSLPTNGNGFYSFYYGLGVNAFFVLPDSYTVRVTYNDRTLAQKVTYAPNTDVTSPGYFVQGAQAFANFLFFPGGPIR